MSGITEEGAHQKWCPHAIASHNDPRRGFHKGEVPDDLCFTCIASRCMAWRWVFVPNPEAFDGPELVQGDKGYCGLAGAPT